MFTVDNLMKVMNTAKEDLETDLRIAKTLYEAKIGFTDKDLYPNHDMLQMHSETITIEKGDFDPIELTDFLGLKSLIKEIGVRVVMGGTTYPLGRHDYFSKAYIGRRYYLPIEEITEGMVKTLTKQRLNKRFMPKGFDEYTFHLDCKLLEQFVAGNLTMEQVVEGSKGDCEL